MLKAFCFNFAPVKHYLYTLLVLSPFLAVAQVNTHSGHVLTGKIIDADTKAPIRAATVVLLRRDSSVAGEVISQPDGDFTLRNVPAATCVLRISVVGYKPFVKTIPGGHTGGPFNTGTIKLAPVATQMQEVAVVARRPVFRTEVDKKVFDVS
ncbi:MAG TPA: carboxypeptidase regulatory-like domain-containing protein, partial [Puia sp.]|nr:carboxypeptidase regulatory-like domain-containing protein [Puia sp.]